MNKRHGKFTLVDKESEADFLIIVLERNATPQAGNPAAKSLIAALYVRDGIKWKPAAKLKSRVNSTFWGLAAADIIKNAEKWAVANATK